MAEAVDSRSNREEVVSPRSKKFYKSNSVKKYLSLGGSYVSDYNSKDYKLTSRFFYQSDNFINEFYFLSQNNYTSSSSKEMTKNSELYDLSLSSKARYSESKNYSVFYHRTIYDDLSKYYYDLHTAIGVGRMIFRDKVELDISLGYHEVKEYGYEVDVIPSIRINTKLTERLTFNQRGYWFFDHESFDNELKTSLIYRFGSRLSFELRHTFEQRRYEGDSSQQNFVVNQIGNTITIGLVFDLE